MATRVERPLEVAHVVILLWVYPWVRKEYREIVDEELHRGDFFDLFLLLGGMYVERGRYLFCTKWNYEPGVPR